MACEEEKEWFEELLTRLNEVQTNGLSAFLLSESFELFVEYSLKDGECQLVGTPELPLEYLPQEIAKKINECREFYELEGQAIQQLIEAAGTALADYLSCLAKDYVEGHLCEDEGEDEVELEFDESGENLIEELEEAMADVEDSYAEAEEILEEMEEMLAELENETEEEATEEEWV